MGEFFQCDTGEIFPILNYLKTNKECFVSGYFKNDVFVITKILWLNDEIPEN